MKVLLVDDSRLARIAVKRILEDDEITSIGDFELFEAASGIEALEKHRTILPDIIFLDITMPYLDGLTALRTIRLTDTQVKIIMVTALGSHRHIAAECLTCGANDIIAKPADKNSIMAILKSAFDKQEAAT